MIKKISLYIMLSVIPFLPSCAVRLVPVDTNAVKGSKGISISVAQNQNVKFYKDDLYTPVYVTIANNTDKKIKLDNKYFMMIDDQNNQYSSVPLETIVKYEEEKNKKIYNNMACPPYCYQNQIPIGLGGSVSSVYPYGNFNPYYPALYPNISVDPYIYYKDRDNNYQIIPPSFYPAYPLQNVPYQERIDPTLMAMKMEEIYPHFQTQGYIYFNQSVKFAETKKVKLIVMMPEYSDEKMEFEFEVK